MEELTGKKFIEMCEPVYENIDLQFIEGYHRIF